MNDDLKHLKSNLDYKSDEIDQLQKRVARLNTEKDGYKQIISYYDLEKNSNDADTNVKLLTKRIDELELILIEYKKHIGDSYELRLCNNSSFKMDDVGVQFIGLF